MSRLAGRAEVGKGAQGGRLGWTKIFFPAFPFPVPHSPLPDRIGDRPHDSQSRRLFPFFEHAEKSAAVPNRSQSWELRIGWICIRGFYCPQCNKNWSNIPFLTGQRVDFDDLEFLAIRSLGELNGVKNLLALARASLSGRAFWYNVRINNPTKETHYGHNPGQSPPPLQCCSIGECATEGCSQWTLARCTGEGGRERKPNRDLPGRLEVSRHGPGGTDRRGLFVCPAPGGSPPGFSLSESRDFPSKNIIK